MTIVCLRIDSNKFFDNKSQHFYWGHLTKAAFLIRKKQIMNRYITSITSGIFIHEFYIFSYSFELFSKISKVCQIIMTSLPSLSLIIILQYICSINEEYDAPPRFGFCR
jgi:hypothetical protein